MKLMMNLAVIGAGFAGLVTAAVFADFKNNVWVLEKDKKKIRTLLKGKVPFYEPGLEALVSKNIKAGRLHFSHDYAKVIPPSEIIFICVGTPNKNGEVDLSALFEAGKSIAKNLKKETMIIIKSTVPPLTNQRLKDLIKKFSKVHFHLVSIPEFLREGKAIEDTLFPDRLIIGCEDKLVIKKVLKLHQPITGQRLICSPESAQLIKYAANAFLATKISFANAIAVLSDKLDIKADDVSKGLGMDKRIGSQFLKPGLGYGGSCLPKDVRALISFSQKLGYNFHLLKSVERINNDRVDYFINKLKKVFKGSLRGKKIVILGLTFKPETSDVREARSIEVIKKLKQLKAEIRVCDPIAIKKDKQMFKGVKFFQNPYQALKGAEVLFLVTEWDEYKNLDFLRVKKVMKKLVVIDGRNVYNRAKLEKLGFVYLRLGK